MRRLPPAGIKAIKLYAWEEPFKKRIEVLRAAELHEIRCMVVSTKVPLLALSRHQTWQVIHHCVQCSPASAQGT